MKPAAPGKGGVGVGGECGPCPEFASYNLAFALQLRKITENLIQGNRKARGWECQEHLVALLYREWRGQ